MSSPMSSSMPSAARRGLVVSVLSLVLTGLGLVLTQAPAVACSCAARDLPVATQAQRADVVLSGTVTGATRERTGDRPRNVLLTYTVDVDRAWQGVVGRDTVEITSSASTEACGLGTVPVGRRYVFFATARGAALSTTSCSGTGVASAALLAEVGDALGEGRPIGVEPSEPEPPVATPVDDSPPPEFGRTAAPGAALALVGLLGLFVVRRRAR